MNPGLPGLALGRRLDAWLLRRLPEREQQTLTQRNVYILPTRAGWGFAATLLVMLLASINYQLNLGYGLTFLLGGAALVSMHQTHANLRRLVLHLRPLTPVFAGEPATLEVVLANPDQARHAVGLALHEAGRHGMAFCDVPAQGSTVARLRWTPPRRGRLPVPVLQVETHFPLGLFRAWTLWRPAATLRVWPAPERPAPPLPLGESAGEPAASAPRRAGGSEFDGVRPWRRGDALRQVAWKKVARSGELVSRDTQTSAAQALRLDWAASGGSGADAEARLSRLAAWVLAADAAGLAYALQLPGMQLPRAGGEAQRRAALDALADWS